MKKYWNKYKRLITQLFIVLLIIIIFYISMWALGYIEFIIESK